MHALIVLENSPCRAGLAAAVPTAAASVPTAPPSLLACNSLSPRRLHRLKSDHKIMPEMNTTRCMPAKLGQAATSRQMPRGSQGPSALRQLMCWAAGRSPPGDPPPLIPESRTDPPPACPSGACSEHQQQMGGGMRHSTASNRIVPRLQQLASLRARGQTTPTHTKSSGSWPSPLQEVEPLLRPKRLEGAEEHVGIGGGQRHAAVRHQRLRRPH